MTLRTRLALIGGFGLWNLLVWGSRVRNIWADDELSTGGQLARTALALSFVAVGVGVLVLLARARRRAFTAGERTLVAGFAIWTTGVWVVRGGQILAGDHGAGFVVVHTVLALASIVLAWAAWRATAAAGRRSPALSAHR